MVDLAERESVILSIVPSSGPGRVVRTWTRYSFNSHFLTPSDGFDFEIGGKTIDKALFDILRPGVKVQLSVDGHPQATGLVDDIEVSADRSSGTRLRVSGRDMFGQIVDAHLDPRMRFTEKMTLEQVLTTILTAYGFKSVIVGSAANRGVLTGQTRGDKRTKKKGKPLKSYTLHRLKPYARESVFLFIARVLRNHGLWIWPSADGTTAIVDIPDFEQTPLYTLRRRVTDDSIHNNIISGSVRVSMGDQPTHIVCSGFGGGGDIANTRLRCFISNPVFSANPGPIQDAYPDIEQIETSFTITSPGPIDIPNPRVMYLHDEEARTKDELANFARRMLAERMQRSLVAHYTVAGHAQNGAVWAPDTIVNVQDDLGGLHEPMYVLSRTLTKDTQSGTRTQLELIRPGSLEF